MNTLKGRGTPRRTLLNGHDENSDIRCYQSTRAGGYVHPDDLPKNGAPEDPDKTLLHPERYTPDRKFGPYGREGG